MPFTEKENWIMITTVMKTSEKSKALPKDMRDQIFLKLHKQYAPSLNDADIKELEQDITDLNNSMMAVFMEDAMKYIGTQDYEKTKDEMEKLVGKEDTKKVLEKLNESKDKELT